MTKSAARERIKEISGELDVLLEKAGIAEAVKKAEEGPLIPYGAMGDDDPSLSRLQNNTLYFDEQFDHLRDNIRRAVFGIEDREIRKTIIDKHRELERAGAGLTREIIEDAERELAKAKRDADNLPWTSAALGAAAWVALGYYFFNLAGAIGGAVIGFFFGQGTIDRARKMGAAAITEAENNLSQVTLDAQEERSRPDTFSLDESVTGERDRQEDYKSAFGDRLREYKAGMAKS